jgi:hypothetical protein
MPPTTPQGMRGGAYTLKGDSHEIFSQVEVGIEGWFYSTVYVEKQAMQLQKYRRQLLLALE